MTGAARPDDGSTPHPSVLVALPGTGSDADYARRAFAPVAAALDAELIAVDPAPEGVQIAYRAALDSAATRHRHVLVAGISIGACVAVDWAVDSTQCVGVLAALPPWIDTAESAPAARSALATAELIDGLGLRGAIEAMVSSSPPWLGAELARSWAGIGPPLRAHLAEAGTCRVPTRSRLAALRTPLAVTAATDDPVHPIEVARQWARHAPRSVLRMVTLDDWGADPATLGRESLHGWLELSHPSGR